MSESNDRQIIVLEHEESGRKFPIVIGFFEVFAIHRSVNNKVPPRPLTHELIGSILDTMGASIEKVVINDLKDMTFFARIILKQDGQTFDIDSRPSDAIALAVQTGAPIFVEEEVLETASRDFE